MDTIFLLEVLSAVLVRKEASLLEGRLISILGMRGPTSITKPIALTSMVQF